MGSNIILAHPGPELRPLSRQVWVSRPTAEVGSPSPAHILPTTLLTQETHGAAWTLRLPSPKSTHPCVHCKKGWDWSWGRGLGGGGQETSPVSSSCTGEGTTAWLVACHQGPERGTLGRPAKGPHHAVQLVLQLLVDPLQRHVVALNPGTTRSLRCQAGPPMTPAAPQPAGQSRAEHRLPTPAPRSHPGVPAPLRTAESYSAEGSPGPGMRTPGMGREGLYPQVALSGPCSPSSLTFTYSASRCWVGIRGCVPTTACSVKVEENLGECQIGGSLWAPHPVLPMGKLRPEGLRAVSGRGETLTEV